MVSKRITNFYYRIIEKLSLINAYHVAVAGQEQQVAGNVDRGRPDCAFAVRNDLLIVVPLINGGVKNFKFFACDQRPVKPAGEVFCFAPKHTAPNYLNP